MATPLLITSSPIPTHTFVNPCSKSPNFRNYAISFSTGCKLDNYRRRRRNIGAINDKSDEPNPADEQDNSVGVKAALSFLNFYKREISPVLPRSCRYVPTCSEYSMIAYKRYGFAKGSALTVWRLCRCNPIGGSGFDPPRWFGEERPREE